MNAGASKLDYYLNRTVTWRRDGCDAHNVTVSITLDNAVPAGPLPAYVANRTDERNYPVRPGDNRLLVSYYATNGTELTRATLNGAELLAEPQTELGHPVFVFDVEIPRGATRTIKLQLDDPSTGGLPEVLRQPLVTPLSMSVSEARCGR